MDNPILYVDTSEVREGKLEELRAALDDLTAFVEANVPRSLGYSVYFHQDGTHVMVVQIHPDSESLEHHMKVAGPAFRRFTELVRLRRIEIYGEPSDALLQQLREKARLLGGGTVMVHRRHGGFVRFVDT
jgi:quinol monooxygenase YgiN